MARDNFPIENAITIIKSVRHLELFDTKTALLMTGDQSMSRNNHASQKDRGNKKV